MEPQGESVIPEAMIGMKPVLVVMAAGIGSRYGGNKQIEPMGLNGEALFDYSVHDALGCGFGRVVFVIRGEIEKAFKARVEPSIGRHCPVDYVFQSVDSIPPGADMPVGRKKPWGTAEAVLRCREVIEGPFAVVNADDFYGPLAFERLGAFLLGVTNANEEGLQMCNVGYRIQDTLTQHGSVSRGVCEVSEEGYLMHIVERKQVSLAEGRVVYEEEDGRLREISKGTLVSMNMWGFTPSLFPILEERFALFVSRHMTDLRTAEYLLPNVVGDLVGEGLASVVVLESGEKWFGVTYPEDRKRVQKGLAALVEAGVYPRRLW